MNTLTRFSIFFFIAFFSLLQAQQNAARFTLLQDDAQRTVVEFQLGDYQLQPVGQYNGQSLQVIKADGGAPLLRVGFPEVQVFSTSLIITDTRATQLSIEVLEEEIIAQVLLAPSKGSLLRTQLPADVPYTWGAVYQHNQWYPSEAGMLRQPYILRDFRGQVLLAQPFQYNPVTKELRIIKRMRLQVKHLPVPGLNILQRTTEDVKVNRDFREIYQRCFLNFGHKAYTPLNESGGLLILCHPVFMQAMEPFVEWKIRKGIPTTLLSVAEAGSTHTSIKQFVQDFYTQHNISYLLLVGDLPQIPSPDAAGGKSDPSYGMLLGNDAYPEVIVGRFSAENVAHVQTQVEKTLLYEIFPEPSAYYKRMIGIASKEGPGDDNELDYEHVRNMRGRLLDYTYDTGMEFYEGSQGGEDAPGNPNANQVSNGINSGAGLILYTGHGSSTSWGTSGFNNSHISQLNNTKLLPIIVSVACVNGEFNNGTCFAEQWLRARKNGQVSGAAGALMSSVNQYWNEPMRAQDEMVDILVESYANNKTRTFGGISFNGCMNMNDVYGASGEDMTKTWHLFGDPTLVLRTDSSRSITVSHEPSIFLGAGQFTVQLSEPGLTVCFSQGNQILAKTDAGTFTTTLIFNPINSVLPFRITVTGFNRTPYLAEIPVVAGGQAFLVLDQWSPKQPDGTLIQPLLGNQLVHLEVSIKNVGDIVSEAGTIILSSSSPFIEILQNTCSYNAVYEGASFTESCFVVQIQPGLANQTNIPCTITITAASGQQWSYPIVLVVSAPAFAWVGYSIDDSAGNNNGRADAGETIVLTLTVQNVGHAPSVANPALLSVVHPHIANNFNPQMLAEVQINQAVSQSFTCQIDPNAEAGSFAHFTYQINHPGAVLNHLFSIKISALVDEANGFSPDFAYHSDFNMPWGLDSQIKLQGAASYRSGAITDGQKSDHSINIMMPEADSLSFYFKVDSEEYWDYLRFFVNETEIAQWSGNVDWTRASYVLPAGSHELRWVYDKDEIISEGLDAAWLDYIDFPAKATPSNTLSISTLNPGTLPRVWPNPASDFLQIQWLGMQGLGQLECLDLSGRVLHGQSIFFDADAPFTFPVAHLSEGAYLIRLFRGNETAYVKWIKQ